jgi:hypothetical protein
LRFTATNPIVASFGPTAALVVADVAAALVAAEETEEDVPLEHALTARRAAKLRRVPATRCFFRIICAPFLSEPRLGGKG